MAVRRLTATGRDGEPKWSADGARIAFTRRNSRGVTHVWTIDADGSHPRQITFGSLSDQSPTWSPDNRHIAFGRYLYGPYWPNALYEVDTQAQRPSPIQLTPPGSDPNNPNIAEEPAWSPDGHRIAFHGTDPDCRASTAADDCLFTLDLATGTSTPILGAGMGCFGFLPQHPDWGPGGRHILFLFQDIDCGGNPNFLAQIDPGGSNLVQIDHPYPQFYDGYGAFSPRFGTQLVFSRARCGPDGPPLSTCTDSSIVVSNADGSNAHAIARGSQPDWQPLPR
jgi:Tol biopolymer transport system component